MKITIVTDTWLPSTNGVITTLINITKSLEKFGHTIQIIHPNLFKNIGVYGYSDVRLSLDVWKIKKLIEDFSPDAIHIATEGPLGLTARLYCKKNKISHNTSYHTKFPEYMNIHYHLPVGIGYKFLRLFHKDSNKVLVTTKTMEKELLTKKFKNLVVWRRGVDHEIFNPSSRCKLMLASRPVLVCVSRVSIEKGLDDFCGLKTTGTKILVGDGPYLEKLKEKYKDVIYVGFKHGKNLAHYFANADVMVFPSRTDTFGVVMLEAMACGTPIAAYPVTGPIDVIEEGINGSMNENLPTAISNALKLDRNIVYESSLKYDWDKAAKIFEENLSKIKS